MYYNFWILFAEDTKPEDENWLLNDIYTYANEDNATMNGYVDKFYNIYRRHVMLDSKEKVDKYIKAVAAIEGLRANKDDPVVYVQKRSVVNTLFTEKGFIEFFSKHLEEGFIEKLETEKNYKELLRNAIFGQGSLDKKKGPEAHEDQEEEGETEEADEADEAGAKKTGSKKKYGEPDNTYEVAKLSFFDKLAGKALNKKELAELLLGPVSAMLLASKALKPIICVTTKTRPKITVKVMNPRY
jgi:hypothetical protein